jgi:hypothetical protein
MKRFPGLVLCFIFLLLSAAACHSKSGLPSGVLSQEKMAGVLWDMIEADQYAITLSKDSALIDSAHLNMKLESLRLYDQVFRLHQVSRDEFRKSYKYYMDHPELTQALFDSLLAKGNHLRGEAYSHQPMPAATRPSPIPPRIRPDTAHKVTNHAPAPRAK